jgi:hypothetical protein
MAATEETGAGFSVGSAETSGMQKPQMTEKEK